MSKRSTSEQVPKDMQVRFDEITQLMNTFSQTYLNEEYASLCRQVAATLCRKRPSPLSQGKAATWACGIIHAIGMVNFLYDASQTPLVASSQIAGYFNLGMSTMQTKSRQIRDLLGMYQMDPDWTLPSKMDNNLLAWMIQVNGIAIDARYASREIQEEASVKG
ncbi:MAG TPA: DUF6398 domain-containing protein [Ktedonosporobacter sp.]|nr:DUF6398 domain-containing protein [Ktedonosporobacter sp.]